MFGHWRPVQPHHASGRWKLLSGGLARVGFIHKGQPKQARALLRNSIQRGLPVIRVEGKQVALVREKTADRAAVTARAYRAGHHQRAPEQHGPAVALVAKPRALGRRAGSRCHLRSGRALQPFLNAEMGVQPALFKPVHSRKPIVGARGSLEVIEMEDEPQLTSLGAQGDPVSRG